MSSYETIVQSMPWLSSNRAMLNTPDKINASILYPNFSKLSQYIDDPYWKKIFVDASRGIFPKGFTFNGVNLMYKTGQKAMKIEDDLQINDFISFIRSNTAMRSKMDLEREKDYEKELKSDNKEINNWYKIRSKPHKRLLIIAYVTKMTKIYVLNKSESNQLATLIGMHLEEDVIKKNIIVEETNISEITSIKWNEIERKFFIDIQNHKESFLKRYIDEDIIYIQENISLNIDKIITIKEWSKFLKEFNKISKKPIQSKDDGNYGSPRISNSNSTEFTSLRESSS